MAGFYLAEGSVFVGEKPQLTKKLCHAASGTGNKGDFVTLGRLAHEAPQNLSMLDWRMNWATAFSMDIEQVRLSMTTSALFEVEVLQPTLIVVPQENVNSLIDDRVQPELMRLFTILADPAVRNVVIDFGQIEYFGSSMLEALLKLWKQVSSLGGKMAVCNISQIGREVLQVGRFDTLWDVCESREAALQAVQAS